MTGEYPLAIQRSMTEQGVRELRLSSSLIAVAVDGQSGISVMLGEACTPFARIEDGLALITVPEHPDHSAALSARIILAGVGSPHRVVYRRGAFRITLAGRMTLQSARPGDIIEAYRDYNAPTGHCRSRRPHEHHHHTVVR